MGNSTFRSLSEVAISREGLCFCPTTNRADIDSANVCRLCGKIVKIMNVTRYTMDDCKCPDPKENEFYFCQRCTGVIPGADGRIRHESKIQIDRFFRVLREMTL